MRPTQSATSIQTMFTSHPKLAFTGKNRLSENGFFCLRVSLALVLCLVSTFLAVLAFAGAPSAGFQPKPAGSADQTSSTSTSSWSIVTSPNAVGSGQSIAVNYLNGVTCPSATECWAVCYSINRSGSLGLFRTLIAQWNGISWTVVPSPNTNATESNLLYGVTCTSETNCWAVGYSYSPNNPHLYQSLI